MSERHDGASLAIRSLVAICALVGIGCAPTIDIVGQYMADDGTDRIGIDLTDLLSRGTVGRFAGSSWFATDVVDYTSRWTGFALGPDANTFTGTVFGGGPATLPVSIDGQAFDDDADGDADRIVAVFTYADATEQPLVLLETDPYEEYRCWGGVAGPCRPAVALSSTCTFTPVGGELYDIEMDAPFRDGDPEGATGSQVMIRNKKVEGAGSSGRNFSPPESKGGATVTIEGDPRDGMIHYSSVDEEIDAEDVARETWLTDGSGLEATNFASCPTP